MIRDMPNYIDKLGFFEISEMLNRYILNMRGGPFSVGIFGDWGSGKTSLMKFMEKDLNSKKTKTVWFNAWKYDKKEVMWNALIQEILGKIANDELINKEEDHTKLKKRISTVALAFAKYAAMVSIRALPYNLIKDNDIDYFLKEIKENPNDNFLQYTNNMENDFNEVVNEYIGDKGYLVIFIDDLDRCLPENAIEIFEAIKLYLDKTNCAVVIGCNKGIVEECIKIRYKDSTQLSAKDYLEKIIQLSFTIPKCPMDKVLSLISDYSSVIGYDKNKDLASMIIFGTKCNPRRIIQLANSFILLSNLTTILDESEKAILCKILIIQLQFPEFYADLRMNPRLLSTIMDICNTENSERGNILSKSTDKMRKWFDDLMFIEFIDFSKKIPAPPEIVAKWTELTQ